MPIQRLHPEFKLNGHSFTEAAHLIDYVSALPAKKFLTQWFDENDHIDVQTSGSTGKPKEIKLLKQYLVNSAFATAAYFKLTVSTTALHCLSSDYIAGKMMWVRAITQGWRMDLVNPDGHPLDGNNKKYDFTAMIPLQVFNSLDQLHQFKTVIIGGGKISNDIMEKLKLAKTASFETYGMTETATHIAVKDIKQGTEHFECLPNVKIAVDQRSCLVIIAPHLAANKVVTNDLVKMSSSKTFRWLGRYDTIINSGGVKLIPEQIEHKLDHLISRRFFVAGIADNKLGEKLILLIEGMPITDLKNKVDESTTLDRFEKPSEVYFLEEFIETTTGKVNRNKTIALLNTRIKNS